MSAQSTSEMSLDRLQRMIDANGADPLRWPEAERPAAQALVGRSPEARQMVARARALDDALAALPADGPDAALARLTAATAFQPPQAGRQSAAARSVGLRLSVLATAFWPRAAVMASMTALGIVVGLTIEPAYSSSDGSPFFVGDMASDVAEDLP